MDNKLEKILWESFGYTNFRAGQKEIISDVLAGKDVLGILPTGTGKSICYQLPAKILNGVTIVVSPLISLMLDQVKELKATNFKEVVALNSFLDFEKRRQLYRNLHHYKLIYVSPEILQQKELLFHLKRLQIDLFVVDEAHCISQWGHEFRPNYQKLKFIITELNNPTVLALSATATREVQQDIIQSLDRPDMIKHIYPMDRTNIALWVQQVANHEEKLDIITSILSRYKVPTLIYFSSKQRAEIISIELSNRLQDRKVAFYHGGMEQMDRIAIQQQFMNDQIDIVCCTSAFGMGINKNNIRFVFHYHFPGQIESYIQEIGRAGRDGEQSISILLYSNQDVFLPQQLIETELPSDQDLIRVYRVLRNYNEQNKLLPKDLAELLSILEVSETQWRFITAQLEKHSINIENSLKYEQSKLDNAFQQVKIVRDSRMELKQKKLREMIDWIESETCLRAGIYTKFQNGYTELSHYCCSNCGINLINFTPKQTESQQEITNWQKKLIYLLRLGEKNETK